MNKFVMGVALGAAIGYIASRMREQGFFEEACDSFNDFASKTKKKAKDIIDQGVNELEYVKDRAEYKMKEGKAKIDEVKK
ncbi:MAG: hypothetical protein LBV72_05725 [Tannerella sp.]|jgi:hypothetical protein|nr:hypothetical protein [Tannerella sp.]